MTGYVLAYLGLVFIGIGVAIAFIMPLAILGPQREKIEKLTRERGTECRRLKRDIF